jgi:Icc protein
MATATGVGQPVQLLHITDTHLLSDAGATFKGLDTAQTLTAVLDQARTQAWPPDGVLLTGDLVHDEQAPGYERLRAILDGLQVPVYPVAGNHDDPGLVESVLASDWIRPQPLVELGAWRLIILDTHWDGEVRGRLHEDQLTWLDASLAAGAGHHHLIAMHHPPVPVGSPWLDRLALLDPQGFFRVVDRHDHVRAVVCGHVHQDFDTLHRGVRYLTTPSTCMQFRPRSAEPAVDARPPGFRWLVLHADGTLTTQVHRLSAVPTTLDPEAAYE